MFWSAGFLIVIVLIYWAIGPVKWKGLLLLSVSFAAAALLSATHACYYLLNVIIAFYAGNMMRKEAHRKKTVLQLTLLWFVGNFILFKYIGPVLNGLSGPGSRWSILPDTHLSRMVFPIGLSYILFRLIHYVVEVYREGIPESSFAGLALYVLFFPTFLAGPVERFQRFYSQALKMRRPDVSDVNYGLLRIAFGLVRKFIIADSLARYIAPVMAAPQDHARSVVLLAVYGYAVRIYMDFAGYTDIAIGVSRLFGYRIMENFNNPFFKKNIALFWRSWHISVYSWIRDYFFFPIFGTRASKAKIYLGIFVSMIVFQLWHSMTWGFLFLGVYHGLGLMGWQLFQETKRGLPFLRKALSPKWLDPVGALFTFAFVGFGFIFFNTSFDTIISIMNRIFW